MLSRWPEELHTEWGPPHVRVLLLHPVYSQVLRLRKNQMEANRCGCWWVKAWRRGIPEERIQEEKKSENVNLMGLALGKTVQRAETVGSEGRHNYG